MAKKRKATRTSEPESRTNNEQTKLTINSWEDVADSGDEFQISRDKILLEEEPARKRRRRLDEEYQELLPSDEEILEIPTSDEDEDEDEDGADEDVEISDDDAHTNGQRQDDEELEEAWGTSRQDYYDADVIETEADALDEEEEALRIQQRQIQGEIGAGYGVDQDEILAESDEEDETELVEKALPQVEITDAMSVEERKRILFSSYPVFQALDHDFISLQEQHGELSSKARSLASTMDALGPDATIPGTVLKWRVLSAYLGVLSLYFVLLTSGPLDSAGKHTTLTPLEMQKHPIMESLSQARMQWEKVRDLDLPDPAPSNGHIRDLSIEADGQIILNGHSEPPRRNKSIKPKMSKPEARALKAKKLAEAGRAARLQQTKDELAQLALSVDKPVEARTTQLKKPAANDSDFGETPTTDLPSQERRKKSLAFYTSQIAAKTNKRSNASRSAGGDDDVPYQERFRDRIARLNEEARARGQGKKDNLGAASDEEDNRIATEVRQQGDEEGYYQTIASRTQAKKDTKLARAAALKEASSQNASIREVETLGADGKRAITYAIEKNKGLTPHRKKENRNPRLKKRLKYEDKMKKLGSMKQVYKGGEGRGGYGGETTGIKSSIVRSRKL